MLDYTSSATAQFQLELRTNADNTLSLTSSALQHIESTINESAMGDIVCYHRFNAARTDVVDKMLKSTMSSGNPFVRYRIGLVTPTVSEWLPWQEHQIVHCSAVTAGVGGNAGHNFEISTADRLYTTGRPTRTVARQSSISGMVEQIAKDNGLECVVEPTSGTFAYIQVNESDVDFIRNRLISRAVNKGGRGYYHLFMRDNVLHFHTPDYQASVRLISYFDAPQSGMVMTDRSQQLWDAGVAGTCAIVYDPYTGKAQEVLSDPDKHLRMSDGTYQLSNVKSGRRVLLMHLGSNEPSEASSVAQNVYNFGRGDTFELNLSIGKSMSVRLGDIVQFILAPESAKTSPWSGYYYVNALSRTIKKESLTTTYQLKRGETKRDVASIVQKDSNSALIPETTAPGQDLNLAVIQKSVLTVGAGQQSSSTVYTSVSDAAKAP